MPNVAIPKSAPSGTALTAAVTQAVRLLESAETVQEVLDYRSQAEALRVLAERARFGLEAANACAELRLRCERRLGELLRPIQRQPPGRPQMVSSCEAYPNNPMEPHARFDRAALLDPTNEVVGMFGQFVTAA
jgi:hypothetical protein